LGSEFLFILQLLEIFAFLSISLLLVWELGKWVLRLIVFYFSCLLTKSSNLKLPNLNAFFMYVKTQDFTFSK